MASRKPLEKLTLEELNARAAELHEERDRVSAELATVNDLRREREDAELEEYKKTLDPNRGVQHIGV